MDMDVRIFFTFYGLSLLTKKIKPKISAHSNPALPFKIPPGKGKFQNINRPIPNVISGNLHGFDTVATSMMKKTFKKKVLQQLRN